MEFSKMVNNIERPRPVRKVINFVGENLSLGDRLSELLYGVLMVSSIAGLVEYNVPEDSSGVEYMLVVLFITVILWGILDGISYALLSAANRGERETLLEELEKEPDKQKRLAIIEEDVSATIPYGLSDSAKQRIYEIVDNGLKKPRVRLVKNRLTENEVRIIFAAFLLDFAALVILVIPFLAFNELVFAGLISHIIALVMFIVIGYYYAKYSNLKAWKGALVCGLVGLALIIFADVTELVFI